MATIFISYNRQSEPIVKSLANDIESLGHTVWFDHELSGGQAWWDQILAKVRDCSVFVFVLSPAGLNSTACKREYTYAAELGKPVLPVLVSDAVSINLLPPALSKIEFVDYRKQDRDAAFRLARAFSTVPPPDPLPDPLPEPPDAPISYLGGLTEQVDTSSILSYPEQTALLVDLKRSLRDPENRGDARTLLQKLRKRRDLFATIAEDIDESLRSAEEPTPTEVSADPGPVSHNPSNANEAATFLLSIGSTGDGTRSRVGNTSTPEPQAPEVHANDLTRGARIKGAGIGVAAGFAWAFLFVAFNFLFSAFSSFYGMVAFPLGGAVAGAISGMNRKRLFGALMGMIVAVLFNIVAVIFSYPTPGLNEYGLQLYHDDIEIVALTIALLVTLLAPPLGALVGKFISRKKQ